MHTIGVNYNWCAGHTTLFTVYHYNICILFSIRCIQCMCVLTTYVLCQLGKCLFWLSKIVETQ